MLNIIIFNIIFCIWRYQENIFFLNYTFLTLSFFNSSLFSSIFFISILGLLLYFFLLFSSHYYLIYSFHQILFVFSLILITFLLLFYFVFITIFWNALLYDISKINPSSFVKPGIFTLLIVIRKVKSKSCNFKKSAFSNKFLLFSINLLLLNNKSLLSFGK